MSKFTVSEAPPVRVRVCLSRVKTEPVAERMGAIASDKFTGLAPAFVTRIDLLAGMVVTVPNETDAGFAEMVVWMAVPASNFPPPTAGMLSLFPELSLVTA